MPLNARWEYWGDEDMPKEEFQKKLVEVLRTPKTWL